MHLFLYTTVWTCCLFYLVCNVELRNTESGKAKSHGRIKGGEPVSINEFPWAVTLRRFAFNGISTHGIQCGGTIIGSKWVLTAAHCTTLDVRPDWITAGRTQGTSPDLRGRYFIKKYHVHESFVNFRDKKGVLRMKRDDIAILELNKKIRESVSVRPIRLSQADVKTDQQCQVVGWGALYYGGPRSSQLMKMNVKIAKNCDKFAHYLGNPDDNICTKSSTDQACPGDSGGPLMCREKNGEYFLKGVLSGGAPCSDVTGASAYAKVNNYVKWIEEKTKLDFGFRSTEVNRGEHAGFTEDGPAAQGRMRHQIANAGSGIDNRGNSSDSPNPEEYSEQKLDRFPRPDQVNDLDGSYKLDGDTAQPEPREPDVADDSKRTSGLDNHDGSLMSTNSASMSMTTSKIFLSVGVPIFIIGLIVVLVVAMVLIRKSSHRNKDGLEMKEHLPKPGTK